jgi:mRNA interferase MazF
MPKPARGEVWRVDLGLTAKVRPCLVISDYPTENELALILVIPHTTAVRHNRWEFGCAKPFLKAGVFHLQQIQPISLSRFEAKLGSLTPDELRAIAKQLATLLKLES